MNLRAAGVPIAGLDCALRTANSPAYATRPPGCRCTPCPCRKPRAKRPPARRPDTPSHTPNPLGSCTAVGPPNGDGLCSENGGKGEV